MENNAQLLKGVLEYCVLRLIEKEPTYGYEIVMQLKQVGFAEISESTLYPLLLRLEQQEKVTVERRPSPKGPSRKYYVITEKGREATRIFEKQLPYPVREAAQRSALRVVRQIRRDAGIHTAVTEHGPNDLTVRMEMEQVFAVEMNVVSHGQAAMLERTFKENAEAVYQTLLTAMTKNYANEKEAQKP